MRYLFLISLLAVTFQSCNEYQKVLKNEDVKAKYDLAEKKFNEGDFKRANRLYEQIAPKYIGKPQGERVLFFYSKSFYEIEDYNFAGYQFERFIKSYPKSDKVPECAFFGAKSYYELSPNYSLDQTDTDKALTKLQNFINTYPDSEYLEEANAMAQELTTKKQRKQFEIAKQFNKLGEFNYELLVSAVAALDNFVTDNPGSIYREDALYYKFEASSGIAFNSFDIKKQERIQDAMSAYNTLIKYFPETKYAKKADNLLGKLEKELQDFSKAK
ncbi:MAG: outer membrane protein assembly factor BamD [Bacteroidota bacterium]